ncbi:Origin recognition complex subunit 3, partial [Dinochytrium kinnereticum]
IIMESCDLSEDQAVVFIFEEFDQFNPKILSNILCIISSEHQTIAKVAVILQTANSESNGMLLLSSLSRLSVETFSASMVAREHILVEELLLKRPKGLKYDIEVFEFIFNERFLKNNLSARSLLDSAELATLSHFYGNPLSALFNELGQTHEHPKSFYNIIRALPSFQRYIEDISNTRPEYALLLIEDDNDLRQGVKLFVKDIQNHHIESSICLNFGEEIIMKQMLTSLMSFNNCKRRALIGKWNDLIRTNWNAVLFSETRTVQSLKTLKEAMDVEATEEKPDSSKARSFLTFVTDMIDSFPLFEAFYFSNSRMLRKSLTPQPLVCLRAALERPDYFLNCKLYSESGPTSDIYQVFGAFENVILKEVPKPKTDAIQARFSKSLAELEYLGLWTRLPRRPEVLSRQTWFHE